MKITIRYLSILFLCCGFRIAEPLNHIYQHGKFLILYTTKGEHALPTNKQKDSNKNDIPDFVENIALQFQAADQLYATVFKLRQPLHSPRYQQKQVSFIKISIKANMDCKGMAFDEISAYTFYDKELGIRRTVNTLAIHINSSIKHNNHTPAHELIHLYQNGYTLFKTRWYTEGMARWVESALAKGTGKVGKLPKTKKERQEQVFDQSYEASLFWNALAKQTDKQKGRLNIPTQLLKLRYTDGHSIIEDQQFYGAQLLKAVLEELDQEDNLVSQKEGLKPYFWEESKQKSPENHEGIWNAIERACKKLDVVYSLR